MPRVISCTPLKNKITTISEVYPLTGFPQIIFLYAVHAAKTNANSETVIPKYVHNLSGTVVDAVSQFKAKFHSLQ